MNDKKIAFDLYDRIGCFNGTQLGSVDQYNELEFANEFQFGNGTFTEEPTWGTNFSVLHCAEWCRENADNGCIGFLTDDLGQGLISFLVRSEKNVFG